jgi:SOS-response transcriptional repressor LexA
MGLAMSKLTLGKFIRLKRTERGLTLQQVADVFGIGRASVSDWESDKTLPASSRFSKLAEVLGTSTDVLLDYLSVSGRKSTHFVESKGKDSPTIAEQNVIEGIAARRLPVISWVQAGEWGEIVDNFQPGDAEEWVLCPFPSSDESFVLKVVGQSMYNPGGDLSFREGDYISVDPRKEPLHRSLVIAKRRSDQSATFKQLLIENDGTILLHALNPSWPNRYITVDEDTSIVGVVTGQWRPL